MTLSCILFFMLERLTCVDAACTLSVAGSKCGAHKQREWLIIGKTLFSSTHWCFIHRKCPQNINSKMARILTTRASCVHEQYHLIHFRHLQTYCRSPTTSAKNLDVVLQAAVPSCDARYFVYERVAKQGIIHSHGISLKVKSLNI